MKSYDSFKLTYLEGGRIAKATGYAIGYIENHGKGFDRERAIQLLKRCADILDDAARRGE